MAEDEDTFTSEIPNVSFSFNFDSNSDKLPCEIGCEGDYSQISAYKGDAIYESYFLVKGKFAVVAGEINTLFTSRIEQLNRDHPEVHTLILVQCPGSYDDDELFRGAVVANQLKYNTCVPSDGFTASGGTDLFLSGWNRFATEGSRIGIHSWSDGTTEAKDLPRDDERHKPYLDLYDKVCVPQSFYWDTTQTDYDGMYYITESDITTKYQWMRDCNNKCDITDDSGGDGGGGTVPTLQPITVDDDPVEGDDDPTVVDGDDSVPTPSPTVVDDDDDPADDDEPTRGGSGSGGDDGNGNSTSCTDTPNWKDANGKTCDEWRSESWCDIKANDPLLTGTGGLMASQGCCNCKGGSGGGQSNTSQASRQEWMGNSSPISLILMIVMTMRFLSRT